MTSSEDAAASVEEVVCPVATAVATVDVEAVPDVVAFMDPS